MRFLKSSPFASRWRRKESFSNKSEMYEGVGKDLLLTTGAIVQFASIVYVVNNYVAELTSCIGPSMLPTINKAGDLVLSEHLTFLFRDPKVGDVVLCKSPKDPKQVVCKRVVGMPYDMVRTTKGKNGPPVEVIVPRGHVWIEGDNPKNSTDSRYYGPVPQALIRGRVLFKIWPIWEFGPIPSAPPRRRFSQLRKDFDARIKSAKKRDREKRRRRRRDEEQKKSKNTTSTTTSTTTTTTTRINKKTSQQQENQQKIKKEEEDNNIEEEEAVV